MHSQKLPIVAGMVVYLLVSFGSVANAQFDSITPDAPWTEERMCKHFDWVITIELAPVPKMLSHKGSTLESVAKVAVTYKFYPRPGKFRNLESIKYEELYFSGNRPIGAKQFNDLVLFPGEVGAVRLLDHDDIEKFSYPVADALVRAYLDLSLQSNQIGLVICPKHAYSPIIDSLGNLNFLRKDLIPIGKEKTQLVLSFTTEPRDKKLDRDYVYLKDFKR
jgi:hypothetical protein